MSDTTEPEVVRHVDTFEPDWTSLPPQAMFTAVDLSGYWWWYSEEPTLSETYNFWANSDTMTSGTLEKWGDRCPSWKHTLRKRPVALAASDILIGYKFTSDKLEVMLIESKLDGVQRVTTLDVSPELRLRILDVMDEIREVYAK